MLQILLRGSLAVLLMGLAIYHYRIIWSLSCWLLYLLLLPFTITLTLRFHGLSILAFIISLITVAYIILHYFVFNRYTRLKDIPIRAPLDLPPEPVIEEPTPGDLLSKIRIFGYLEPEVYAELVRCLEERSIQKGELVKTDGSFWLVSEGRFEMRIRKPILDLLVEDEMELVLSEVCKGGILSSLFEILSILTNTEMLNAHADELGGHFRVRKIAITDSRCLVIPESAFYNIMEKYPKAAAHIVQIIMSRFHRVTFMTLQRYLGLGKEVLYTVKAFNQNVRVMNINLFDLLENPDLHAKRGPLIDMVKGISVANSQFIQQSVWEHVMEFLKLAPYDKKSSSPWDSIVLRTIPAGFSLVTQGERNPGLFVLIDGELLVVCESQGSRHELVLSKPGSIIGAIAAIFGHHSLVHVYSKTECLAAIISKAVVDRIVEKHPDIHMTIARRLLHCLSPLVKVIDTALEWNHLDSGQTLCYQGDPAESIHIILHGRVRAVYNTTSFVEYGAGESFGELEMLLESTWPGTVQAIRDTEIASMQRHIFDCLSQFHPEISLNLSRILALKCTNQQRGDTTLKPKPLHFRSVAILPISAAMQGLAADFAHRLQDELSSIGPTLLLDQAVVSDVLGRHAFRAIGKLKLLEWLHLTEEEYRLVLYLADSVQSPWTQRCIRQADIILFIAHAASDNDIGPFERLVFGSMARKEFVFIHDTVTCPSGLSRRWLNHRLWITHHHHVFMNLTLYILSDHLF